MRKIYNLVFVVLATFCSCQDNADYPFIGKDAVYFQLQSNDYYWKETLDSLVYSFAGKGVDEDTLWVRVNLEGNVSPENRAIRVVTDAAGTSAEEGLHYEALKTEYYLPADSVFAKIPIIIYNKDKELESKEVTIKLALEATQDLELGITDRRTCRLIVSNTLNKPTYWDSTIKYDFGVYSRRKHELCMQILGRDFPEDGGDYTSKRNMWKVYGAYMSDYFEDNYPVPDENGTAIEPW